MAGRSASHAFDPTPVIGAADAAAQSALNLLLLALMKDIPGVQT